MHLTPEIEYMVISKTHEYYLTISVNHMVSCKELHNITLCPETFYFFLNNLINFFSKSSPQGSYVVGSMVVIY